MSHTFSMETQGGLVEKGVDRRVKQGSPFDPACFHVCFVTHMCDKFSEQSFSYLSHMPFVNLPGKKP